MHRTASTLAGLAAVFAAATSPPLGAQAGVIFQAPPESFWMQNDLPGLCGLEFRFIGSDQHLKTMKGIPDLAGDDFLFDLADNDHGQATYGKFLWWDLAAQGTLRFTTRSNCRDGCWLTTPVVGASEELVLAGIDLRFTGTDRHIRDIEVWPEPELGRIWVRFRDNSTTNAFNATIAYVLLPRGHLERFTSTSTADEWAIVDRPKAAGTSYIQGFKARFRNGDHHLQRFFVDVCGSRVQGVLHDSGGVNDPYRLDVRYVANQPIY